MRLVDDLKVLIGDQLEEHDYNSVGNFLSFYEAWKSTRTTRPVIDFYRDYDPVITPKHHTCVGLGLDLISRTQSLQEKYPGIKKAVFAASCEEDIVVESYVHPISSLPDPVKSEKEHVIAAIPFKVGGRRGVILMDTGYHVPLPVIVMKDGAAPETGWFKVNATKSTERWYKYEWHANKNYIIWKSKVIKGEKTLEESALIFIGKIFKSTADTTERRNLIYPFKSWLKRDKSGVIISGFFFALKSMEEASVTFIYTDESGKQISRKLAMSNFGNNNNSESAEFDPARECQLQLGILNFDFLMGRIVESLSNEAFVKQVVLLNNRILTEISGDN